MIRFLLGKILCLFNFHNWEIIGWYYKNTMRFDNCTRCKKTQKIYDIIGAKSSRDIRFIAWQERRRVIVEKHKNIKKYELSVKYPNANGELLRLLEFQSSDSKYESLKASLMKTCADNEISEDRVHIKCLDIKNDEIPEMFLL